VRINQLPISETTLRLWDASTLEDLHPPPLPSDLPDTPSISVQSISWFPEEWPSSVDDLRHSGFAKQLPLIGPSPEISLIRGHSDLEDDDNSPTQAPQLLCVSGRKRKFVECDSDLDVARDVPSSKRICLELIMSHTNTATRERSPEAHYHHCATEESVYPTPWSNSGCVPGSCPVPDVPVLSSPAIPLSVDTSVSQDQSSGDTSLETQSPSRLLQCHEVELSYPESLATSLAASAHALFPNHSTSDARPQSASSDAPSDPFVDDMADLSSDSSLTSDDSSCGSWAYLETLEPDSPTGAFVTLRDGLCQAPNLDVSNPSFIFDLSTDVEIDLTRHHQLERPRLLEGSKAIFDNYKRKRLFITNEDEYEERPCKRRSIEQ
jgi:hypothetical protein